MVYLNMDNYEEALNHLDLASKLVPKARFYSQQLNVLLKHMASSKAFLSSESPANGNDTGSTDISFHDRIKRKILVVENNSTICKVISIILSLEPIFKNFVSLIFFFCGDNRRICPIKLYVTG